VLPLSQVNEAFELPAAHKIRGSWYSTCRHEPRHRGGPGWQVEAMCFIRLQPWHVVFLDVDAA